MTTLRQATLELERVAAACGMDHEWWNEALAKYHRSQLPEASRVRPSVVLSNAGRTADTNARVMDAIRALDGEPADIQSLGARAGLSHGPVRRMLLAGLIQVDADKRWTIAGRPPLDEVLAGGPWECGGEEAELAEGSES